MPPISKSEWFIPQCIEPARSGGRGERPAPLSPATLRQSPHLSHLILVIAMFICKNCGETSPNGTLVCPCCRMGGRFKQQENPGPERAAPNEKDLVSAATCRNCAASLQPGMSKCPTCRLPVTPQQPWARLADSNGLPHPPITQFFN